MSSEAGTECTYEGVTGTGRVDDERGRSRYLHDSAVGRRQGALGPTSDHDDRWTEVAQPFGHSGRIEIAGRGFTEKLERFDGVDDQDVDEFEELGGKRDVGGAVKNADGVGANELCCSLNRR